MAKIYLFHVTQGGQGKHSSDCHASVLLALSLKISPIEIWLKVVFTQWQKSICFISLKVTKASILLTAMCCCSWCYRS
jgi:hypothetical protein